MGEAGIVRQPVQRRPVQPGDQRRSVIGIQHQPAIGQRHHLDAGHGPCRPAPPPVRRRGRPPPRPGRIPPAACRSRHRPPARRRRRRRPGCRHPHAQQRIRPAAAKQRIRQVGADQPVIARGAAARTASIPEPGEAARLFRRLGPVERLGRRRIQRPWRRGLGQHAAGSAITVRSRVSARRRLRGWPRPIAWPISCSSMAKPMRLGPAPGISRNSPRLSAMSPSGGAQSPPSTPGPAEILQPEPQIDAGCRPPWSGTSRKERPQTAAHSASASRAAACCARLNAAQAPSARRLPTASSPSAAKLKVSGSGPPPRQARRREHAAGLGSVHGGLPRPSAIVTIALARG